MPHPTNQNSVVWNTLSDDGFDEIQHFSCPWTITTHNESITVDIIYLKWTFNYDFWIRVEINPQRNRKVSQLLEIDELLPLFKSLATALLNYYDFLEPHLTEFQLHVYGELMDHLSYKVDCTTIMTNTHLAYPDIASDKFSGTDPDQDVEPFVQLERKINFALGDAPAGPDDLVSYTFCKKGDEEENDILIILYEDFVQGTYNEKLKSTWWNIRTQLGTISPQESSKEMWVTRSLRNSSMMRNRPKFN